MGGSFIIIIIYFIVLYFAVSIIRKNSEALGKTKLLLNSIILLINTMTAPLGYVVFYLNIHTDNKLILLYAISIVLITIVLYHLIIFLYIIAYSLIKHRKETEMIPYMISLKLSLLNLPISLVNAFFIVMLFWGLG